MHPNSNAHPDPMHRDVVIAGAGPVGLFLACELRLAGLSVLVLEREQDPRSPLKRLPFGMRGLSAPTIEAFYRRGWLDDIAQATPSISAAAHWMQQPRRAAGHFAGIQFYQDRIDGSCWPYRLAGPAATNGLVEMEALESALAARAVAMGVEIRRGIAVRAFDGLDEAVTIRAGGETFRASWLVGCDGGRSTVRRAGGFGFIGTEPELTGYSAEIEMAHPDELPLGRHHTPTGMFTHARPGTIAMVEFDGGACHRTLPITIDHIQAVLSRVSGTDVTVTALRLATTWTDRAFQATTYRRGRVLLAGDAAHIHSPLGGQGLNLGFGDAMNLGWKLAATIRGDAPAGLLDSYAGERHPVAVQILDWSRAQVALMRPDPGTRALAAIIRDLVETQDGATYFAGRLWGISLRYDLGIDHPLVGRFLPDFELAGEITAAETGMAETGMEETRAATLQHEGKGLFLDFDPHAPFRALASRWSGRIAYVAAEARDRLGLSALLVRPDGIVVWAGEAEPDHEAVARAASRWFGAARP